MRSLFNVVNNQHRDEFAPIRGNRQTMRWLVRSFEDLVIDNKLSALVVQGRCRDGDAAREAERISRLAATARQLYLFSCEDTCPTHTWLPQASPRITLLEDGAFHSVDTAPFVVVMDQRFCGLLASNAVGYEDSTHSQTFDILWTFDPNVVFTATEYLLERIAPNGQEERAKFEEIIKECTPRSYSLKLALSFTTKLTISMQRQNELETAINSISSAISSTLEQDRILQSAVEEVGRALKARRAALILWEEGTQMPESMTVYERDGDVGVSARRSGDDDERSSATPGYLETLIIYRDNSIGILAVEDETVGRVWEDEELLMVRTASDQLAVAISNARLFHQVQTQAMTDALTGLYNRGYFQNRLERELKLADRNSDKVSLILLDLDHLKRINDSFGHRAGDACLCHVANIMRASVREVDICARYGGEEFVVILPQCNREDVRKVAERLREAIANSPVQKVGQITASIGVATYPGGAGSQEELIETADRAMYMAKAAGRNRVRATVQRSGSTVSNVDCS